jgi:hypothetical protein
VRRIVQRRAAGTLATLDRGGALESRLADFGGDGVLDVVAGRRALHADGTAFADLDRDGRLEGIAPRPAVRSVPGLRRVFSARSGDDVGAVDGLSRRSLRRSRAEFGTLGSRE